MKLFSQYEIRETDEVNCVVVNRCWKNFLQSKDNAIFIQTPCLLSSPALLVFIILLILLCYIWRTSHFQFRLNFEIMNLLNTVELRWETVCHQDRTIQNNVNIHPAPQVWFEHVISVFEQSKTVYFFDYMAAVFGPMHTFTAKSYTENSQLTSYMKNHTSAHTVRLQARANTLYESFDFFNVNERIYSSYMHCIALTFKACSRGGIVQHHDQKEWFLLHCCLSCPFPIFCICGEWKKINNQLVYFHRNILQRAVLLGWNTKD
jgi:hypothetical protein